MSYGMMAAAAIQAYGSIMQGQSNSNALNAQANLQIQNAAEAEAQGAYNAQRSSMLAGQKIGDIQANYGASGVTSTSGSVSAILSASASSAELDRLNILHGADLQAINYQNQASMERAGAASGLTGSLFSAAGAIGQGALSAYGRASTPPVTNIYNYGSTGSTTLTPTTGLLQGGG